MCEKPGTENTRNQALDYTKKQGNNHNRKSLRDKHRQWVTTLKQPKKKTLKKY